MSTCISTPSRRNPEGRARSGGSRSRRAGRLPCSAIVPSAGEFPSREPAATPGRGSIVSTKGIAHAGRRLRGPPPPLHGDRLPGRLRGEDQEGRGDGEGQGAGEGVVPRVRRKHSPRGE